MILVVDASVAFKWYVQEALSDQAIAILRSGQPLAAPNSVSIEVANVLSAKVRNGDLSLAQARQAIADMNERTVSRYPAEVLLDRAMAISIALKHAVYECLYVALAEVFDCQVVTADERLIRRAIGTAWQRRILRLDFYRPA